MKFKLCLDALLIVFLLVLAVGHVNAQSSAAVESADIAIDCKKGTVDVSCSEYFYPVNGTSPVHTPSGVDLTDMNSSNVKDVLLTFSTADSTLAVWTLVNATTSKSVGDAWATMLSTPFQTSYSYDYASARVHYKAPGKNSLSQYMQWLMSQCFVSDLNGFSLALMPIVGRPGSSITVDIFPSSNNEWGYIVKCSYQTSIPIGSGDHTIDFLNLLGVSSLAPSPYSGYYDTTYLTEVYLAAVDVGISSSQTVTYTSCQPPGFETIPASGVLPLRGWSDPEGSGAFPVFDFENDSSPVSQLTYTFNAVVIPELPSNPILPLFMAIFTVAAIMKRVFPKKTKNQN